MPHLVWALGVVEAIGLMSAGGVVGFGFGQLRKLHITQRRALEQPPPAVVARVDRPEIPARTGGGNQR